MDTQTLIEWINNPHRKPAALAFTEGPERQIAYHIEGAIRRAQDLNSRRYAALRRSIDPYSGLSGAPAIYAPLDYKHERYLLPEALDQLCDELAEQLIGRPRSPGS